MKIIGTITAGARYIFAITSGLAMGRLDVYSLYEPTSDIELQEYMLNSVKVVEYNRYLLCSARIAATGYITKYAGNIGIATTVLGYLQDSGELAKYVSGEIEIGEYEYNACSVAVRFKNSAIATVAEIKGLNYVASKINTDTSEVIVGLQKHKLKTYGQIIVSRDMSWYFDANGKVKKDYRLIQSLAELEEVMKDATGREYMSFDTETTGTNFYWHGGNASKRSKICGMSLSWRKDQGIYIPFMSEVFNSLDLDQVMTIVYPIMQTKKIVTHNGIFDFKVLYSYGYYIPIAHDTLLMAFNLDPEVKRGSKGLKTLTRKYLNHETIELDEITGKPVVAELIPYIDKELIKIYACSDSDYTLQLCDVLLPHVKANPSYILDTKLIDILSIAEYHGAPIDTKLLKTMSLINKRDMQHVENLMTQYIRLAGTQALAVRAIQGVAGSNYNPSADEIKSLCEHPQFLTNIEPAFYKQTKSGSGQDRKPLQYSAQADVAYILYDLLGYPVLKMNDSGSRTSDKEALSRLLDYPATSKQEFLKGDILTSAPDFGVDSTDVVISKSTFEGYRYPFAYLLSVWRKLQKFDTAFFEPLLAESSTGYYCTDNSMTSAETGRVINPIQTLEGSLKNLVIPRNSDWYLIVFDKSQIEYRVMLGLASNYWNGLVKSGVLAGDALTIARSKNLDGLIESLNNWEKDYHREGGAIFAGCTPDTMTSKQRKKVKAIHFSVPYGAEAASVAKPKLAGHPESEWGKIIAETEADLSAWRDKLYPLYFYLEHVRDVALTPLAENPFGVCGTNGMVKNAMGRYRLFSLDDDSFKERAGIRRKAGNYPIQSLARDIFFSGVYKLFQRLKQEGIICDKFEDCKAFLNLFVHDEVVLQVHKSIHPYRMYKYIMETNLTKLSGHPTYFMGIAVANTWREGKTDKYEAPIDYVNQCIAEYEANQEYYDNIESTVTSLAELDYTQLCLNGITSWFAGRVCRELKKVLGNTHVIDPVFIHEHLLNYYVKSRLGFYAKPCRKAEYQMDPSLPVGTGDTNCNAFIKLFDYFLLLTGEYKNYCLRFNGEDIPYEQVLDISVLTPDTKSVEYSEDDSELANLFDTLADADFEIFSAMSEMEEDSREREASAAEEVYLLDDPGLTVDTTVVKRQIKTEEEKSSVPTLWSEDRDGSIVFFVNGMTEVQLKELTAFLAKYVSPDGKPLFFFTDHKVSAKVKITVSFTAEQVYAAVYGTDKIGSTSYFGG